MSIPAFKGKEVVTQRFDRSGNLLGMRGKIYKQSLPADKLGPERGYVSETHNVGRFRLRVENGAFDCTGPVVTIYTYDYPQDVVINSNETPFTKDERGPFAIITYSLKPNVPMEVNLKPERKPGPNRVSRQTIVWKQSAP